MCIVAKLYTSVLTASDNNVIKNKKHSASRLHKHPDSTHQLCSAPTQADSHHQHHNATRLAQLESCDISASLEIARWDADAWLSAPWNILFVVFFILNSSISPQFPLSSLFFITYFTPILLWKVFQLIFWKSHFLKWQKQKYPNVKSSKKKWCWQICRVCVQ